MVSVHDGLRAAVALRDPVAPRLEDWEPPEGTVLDQNGSRTMRRDWVRTAMAITLGGLMVAACGGQSDRDGGAGGGTAGTSTTGGGGSGAGAASADGGTPAAGAGGAAGAPTGGIAGAAGACGAIGEPCCQAVDSCETGACCVDGRCEPQSACI